MEFSFGKKLKELRLAKDVTQDALAQHLQISPQAISKWERGTGYPDIMLLPRIAAFFDVSVDELLGTGEEIRREKIEKWTKESFDYRHTGQIAKNYELWKSAYNEYPNDQEVIVNYMYALSSYRHVVNDASIAEKAVELGEFLLQKSPDTDKRDSARQVLVILNRELGNKAKAREYAEAATDMITSRNFLLNHVLEGEELIEHSQLLTMELITHAADEINYFLADNYPHNEAIEIWKYVIGLYKGLFPRGDLGFYNLRMSEFSGRLSRRYAMAGERELCLEELKHSVEYIKAFEEWAKRSEIEKHTSPLLNRIDMDRNYTVSTDKKMSYYTLKDLDRPVYDPYREDKEFIRIRNELEADLF